MLFYRISTLPPWNGFCLEIPLPSGKPSIEQRVVLQNIHTFTMEGILLGNPPLLWEAQYQTLCCSTEYPHFPHRRDFAWKWTPSPLGNLVLNIVLFHRISTFPPCRGVCLEITLSSWKSSTEHEHCYSTCIHTSPLEGILLGNSPPLLEVQH